MDLTRVISSYPIDCRPRHIEPLGNAGGFSGAMFWRLDTPRGLLCLRRWPCEHPSAQQLQFIHAVLRHVADCGLALVPVPLECLDHSTAVWHDGYLWELTPWMPGTVCSFEQPGGARLEAALEALARFHQAAATFPSSPPRQGHSPAICSRSERLARWLAGDLERLRQYVQPGIWPEALPRARRILELAPILAPGVAAALTRAENVEVPLQVSIGDIWHDHVLFEGDRVSGLIDFGAMRVDSVAGDLARLLGSIAGDAPELWKAGLEIYESIRPLSDSERSVLASFDQSTVLLGALNWLEWIYRERRVFGDSGAVLSRLDGLIVRQEHLCRKLADVSWYP